MTNPIEQVIAYLKNDGLETDVIEIHIGET